MKIQKRIIFFSRLSQRYIKVHHQIYKSRIIEDKNLALAFTRQQ